MLPFVLIMFSLFAMFTLSHFGDRDTMYWVTVASYWVLASLFFFRRPYLKIGRRDLSTRKWNKEITVNPDEIEEIIFGDNDIVIVLKEKKTRWVFARITNLYPVNAMKKSLRAFAAQHAISIKDGQ